MFDLLILTIFGPITVGFAVFTVLSYEVGLCFVTGKGYKGKLFTINKHDINLRRKQLVRALKQDNPKFRPPNIHSWRHIELNALLVGLSLYTLPVGKLIETVEPNIGSGLEFIIAFMPTVAFMFLRVYRPLGMLRPYWMRKHMPKL